MLHDSQQPGQLMADPTPDEARAVGIRFRRHWPQGTWKCPEARRALVDWATAGGYRLAEPGLDCLHWVIGQARRCGALRDRGHDGRINSGTYLWDHPTFWTGPRGRFLLAQPYAHVKPEDYDAVRQTWPVEIAVTETSPWYGPSTLGVIVRPRNGATP